MAAITERDETLAAIGHRIDQAFNSWRKYPKAECPYGISLDALEDEFQRFDLWAVNMGLFHRDHRSLDYRFGKASSVYAFAKRLLTDLEKCLSMSKSSRLMRPFASMELQPT